MGWNSGVWGGSPRSWAVFNHNIWLESISWALMWITAKLLWQFWSSSITKRFDIILQTPEHPHSLPKVCVKPIDFSLFNGMQNYHSNIAYFKPDAAGGDATPRQCFTWRSVLHDHSALWRHTSGCFLKHQQSILPSFITIKHEKVELSN